MKPIVLFFFCVCFLYAGCERPDRTPEQTPTARLQYPPTKTVNQVDTYHGVKVADPYRWLENDTARDVKAWVQAQNKVTFDYLSKIPFREEIRRRIKDVIQYPLYSLPQKAGEYYFFTKGDGVRNQPVIYRQKGLGGEPEVFLDPNALAQDGTTRVSFITSYDDRYVALQTQAAGSDWTEITVREVATGKQLPDTIRWAKSGASWRGDGFYYSRFDAPAKGKEFSQINEFEKVYFHRLGTAQSEDELIYVDPHPQTLAYGGATEDGRFLVLYLLLGKDKTDEIRVQDLSEKNAPLKTVLKGKDGEFDIVDNIGGKLLVRTFRGAPNFRLVLIDPQHPEETNWQTIIPEKPEVLERVIAVVGGKIFARYLKDVSSRVYQHDLTGKLEHEIKLPGLGMAEGFYGHRTEKEVFYQFMSTVYPRTIYRYTIATGASSVFKQSETKLNPENYEVKQVFYPGKDGTKIPMFLTYRKGLKLDGTNPVKIYAYGGYAINSTPYFSSIDCMLMDLGVVSAVANIRGGGEYGEAWHRGGMLLNTQNRFDDFIAAAEYLIKEKYTSKEKIAISGGSHGGNLVGTVMLQRPDLFKVVLPAVGTLDMLRFQHFTIGHNWKREYGDSDSLVHFKNLYAYSPVHNVKKGVNYPATLVTTADHDDRVVPMHSYKFISELQAKQAGPHPVLIRVETNSGHGASSLTKRIEDQTDAISFALYNLGVKVEPNDVVAKK
ncbi:MAG: S9 family peptidase [Ferruginibacter sp.]|nr:S9 family peptidase [Cytophagales bacterium]